MISSFNAFQFAVEREVLLSAGGRKSRFYIWRRCSCSGCVRGVWRCFIVYETVFIVYTELSFTPETPGL